MRAKKVHNNKNKVDNSRCDVSWQDKVLAWCSGSQYPSSLTVEGARRAWVSAPPTLWCPALVATGVIRHQYKSIFL